MLPIYIYFMTWGNDASAKISDFDETILIKTLKDDTIWVGICLCDMKATYCSNCGKYVPNKTTQNWAEFENTLPDINRNQGIAARDRKRFNWSFLSSSVISCRAMDIQRSVTGLMIAKRRALSD